MGHSAVRVAWLGGADPADTTTPDGALRVRVELANAKAGDVVVLTCTGYQDVQETGNATARVAVGSLATTLTSDGQDVDVVLTPVEGSPSPDPARAILVRTDVTYPRSTVLEPPDDFSFPADVGPTWAEVTVEPLRGLDGEAVTVTAMFSQYRAGYGQGHGRLAYALASATVSQTLRSPGPAVRVAAFVDSELYGDSFLPGRPVVATTEVTFPCVSLLQPGADGPYVRPSNLPLPTWSMWDWVN